MDAPSPPGALTEAWRALVESVKAGEPALGERLYLLGAGPVPVSGAAGGALTLTRDGDVVLVVGLAEASSSAASEIARQLDGIERLPGSKLREAGVDPSSGGGLAQRHAAFFGLDSPLDELNTGQRCIVVLPEGTDESAPETLRTELGDRLHGVFAATAAGATALEAAAGQAEIVLEPEPEAEPEPLEAEAEPEPLEAEAAPEETRAPEAEAPETETEVETPETEAGAEAGAEGPVAIETELDGAPPAETAEEDTLDDAAAALVEAATGQPVEVFDAYLADESATVITEESDVAEKTGMASWPIGNWIGLSMVLVGIVLAVLGVFALFDNKPSDPVDDPPGDPNPLIRTVVSGVLPDATHARWIGQQRVVTLSDGTFAFVYATEEGLNVVKDETNGGDSWGEPFALTEVQPVSLSVDVDSKDRLHVAYSDGASINYVRLKNKPAGWKPSRLIQLDDNTTSLNVDVAWDEQNQTAHMVWVQQSDDGEAPAWAALTNAGGIHVAEQGLLAPAGTDVPVLAAIAADGRSSLLVTYRRGDATTGWSSRYLSGPQDDGTWAFNPEEAIPISSFVGAVDVIYDRQKTAHLVLRDSTNFALTYYSKTQDEPWTEAEVAHEGKEVTAVEFPVLSASAADGYVYLFFQTDEYDPAGEVAYVVGTDTGWSEPFDIVTEADAPEGAQYPVAPDRVDSQALVFWTKTAETYSVDTVPVQAP